MTIGRAILVVSAIVGTAAALEAQTRRGEFHPAWSPDGTRIAFASDEDGDFDIYVAETATGVVRQLTFNDVLDAGPWFVPTGDSIVFSTELRLPNRSIYVVSVVGGPANAYLVLPNTSLARPMVLRSGWILLTAGLGTPDRDVIAYELDSRSLRTLVAGPTNDEWASWDPERDLVLFSSERTGQWEVFATGSAGRPRQITVSPAGAVSNAPQLSPDATSFVYQSNKSGDTEVYLREIGSGREVNLTQSPGSFDGIPVYSPDGTRIAFESTRGGGVRRIFIMDADGSNPRPAVRAR